MRKVLLYIQFIKKIFKVRLIYIGDFILSFILNLVSNLYSLIFIGIIFANIPVLGEWKLYEILLIYGLNLVCRGIFCTFFGELDLLGDEYILDGKLDMLLLRPVSPLFSLMTSNIYEENLTDVFLGFLCIAFSMANIHGLFQFKNILVLLFSIIMGVILYFAIFLIVSSLTFWFNSRFSLLWSFLDLTEYSGYPLDIFTKSVRRILTWIIPFGLISFYPSIIMLDKMKDLHWVGYCIPFVTIFFMALGIMVWRKGLEKYESVGN